MSRIPVLLSGDIGTSGCRVGAFTLDGALVATHGVSYQPRFLENSMVEQPLGVVEDALLTSLSAVVSMVDDYYPIGLSVDAQLGTVFHDRDGAPLGEAITWLDRRADLQARRIEAELGSHHIYAVTGRRPTGELMGPKLLWLAESSPDLDAQVARVLSLKDHMVWQLTGSIVTDLSHASYSLLFDVTQQKWDIGLIQAMRIDPSRLPPILPATAKAGGLKAEVALKTGLPPGLPVAVGGPDGSVGCAGAGLTRSGIAVNVTGTSDVVLIGTDRPLLSSGGRLNVNCFLTSDFWVIGGPTGMTGGCLDWFVDTFPPPGDPSIDAYARAEAAVSTTAPGANGLRFSTNLTGSRTPTWNSSEQGAISGIDPTHSWGHFARGIMEGVASQSAEIVTEAELAGALIREVRLVGGGTRIDLWSRIRARALRQPVFSVKGSSLVGSAMIAGVAVGSFAGLEDAARAFGIESSRQPVPPE